MYVEESATIIQYRKIIKFKNNNTINFDLCRNKYMD